MPRPSLSPRTSEGVVASATATLYAAHQSSGRVEEGREKEWLARCVKEALWIAHVTDDLVHSAKELS